MLKFRHFWFCLFTATLSSAFIPVSSTAPSNLKLSPMSIRKNSAPGGATTSSTTTASNQQSKGALPFTTPGRGGATKLRSAPIIFNNAPLIKSTVTFALANGLGWIISLATGSHVHLDLLGTGAFAVAGLSSILGDTGGVLNSVQLSGGMMTLWGAKLAGFLFFRALQVGHDKRLEETLSSFSGITVFWIISLVWGIFASLPHTLGATSSAPGTPLTTQLGIFLYAIGLTFETLADVQKWNFKQNNPSGAFCNVGVWSLSQHPNWFGNLALWSGIFLLNAPALIENLGPNASFLQKVWGARRMFAAALSPLFLWALFSGQANGSMTNALELATTKYGDDPIYQEYIAKVPLIIPNPLKWFSK